MFGERNERKSDLRSLSLFLSLSLSLSLSVLSVPFSSNVVQLPTLCYALSGAVDKLSKDAIRSWRGTDDGIDGSASQCRYASIRKPTHHIWRSPQKIKQTH